MTETTAESGDTGGQKKKSPMLLIAVVAAVLLGGGAFGAVFMGLVSIPFLGAPEPEITKENVGAESGTSETESLEGRHEKLKHQKGFEPTFVTMDQIVISLGPNARSRHLKISLVAEVDPDQVETVTNLKPRILDVINTYLRAIDERDLVDPKAMMRLRAQMLRRVRLVTPPDSVHDLLVQEFLLN